MATPKQIDKLRTAAQVGVTISGDTLVPGKEQDGTEAFKMSITELSPFLTDKGLRIGTTGIISGTLQDVKDAAATNTGIKLSNTTFEYTGITKLIGLLKTKQGSNIASATTTDLSAANGNYVHITGTTTITGFGTVDAGVQMLLVFDGALLLTYNATSMILPTAANITTVAGDSAIFVSEGSGNWRCVDYIRKSGALLGGITVGATDVLAGGANRVLYQHQTSGKLAQSPNFTIIDSTGQMLINYDVIIDNTKYITGQKRPRTLTENAPGATPAIDGDALDSKHFTGLNTAITSMSVSGTRYADQQLLVSFTDNGTARAIALGSDFENGAATIPTSTVISTRLDMFFIWNSVTSKWRCMAAG